MRAAANMFASRLAIISGQAMAIRLIIATPVLQFGADIDADSRIIRHIRRYPARPGAVAVMRSIMTGMRRWRRLVGTGGERTGGHGGHRDDTTYGANE